MEPGICVAENVSVAECERDFGGTFLGENSTCPDLICVPNWPKCEPWACDALGNTTISAEGCALSTLTMALKAAGVDAILIDVLSPEPLNPGSLARLLSKNNLIYKGGGLKNWNSVVKVVAAAANKPVAFRWPFFEERSSLEKLEEIVCTLGFSAIVGVKINAKGNAKHFVLVTGRDVNGAFTIHDSAAANRQTLDDFGNNFQIRGYVVDPPPESVLDVSALGAGDGVNLMVTDPQGRSTGIDPLTGDLRAEIPISTLFGDAIEDDETGAPPTDTLKNVPIAQPAEGNYQIDVSGIDEPVLFDLSIRGFAADGTDQGGVDLTGVTGPGSTSSFNVIFDANSTEPPQAIRQATLETTLADIDNGLLTGMIGNRGVANALSSMVEAAQRADTRGQRRAAVQIIGAFILFVEALPSRKLDDAMRQILMEDADSLISALQM